jgi:hypothetical protein
MKIKAKDVKPAMVITNPLNSDYPTLVIFDVQKVGRLMHLFGTCHRLFPGAPNRSEIGIGPEEEIWRIA